METSDRYLAIHNLGLIQRQAGVDPRVAELVVAYGRLAVDAGRPLAFDQPPFGSSSLQREALARLRANNPEVDGRFLAFLAAYAAMMTSRGFASVLSIDDLARELGHDLQGVKAVAAKTSALYREVHLPRKNGTFRTIHSPREPLRSMQRWIARHVLRAYQPHPAAHGFVVGRSIVSNATPHVGRAYLVSLDIADFFPSITWGRVRKAFEKLGYPYSVALLLANLCTRRGVLPQGAATSPGLSNIVCECLDRRLAGLARSRGMRYSRYADDMTFSSDDERVRSMLPFIRQLINEEGFQLRDQKTRILRKGARRTVTGIVVNQRANLPRAHVRMLRAAAHRMATRGPEAVKIESRSGGAAHPARVLAGHLAYLSMVNASSGRLLAQLAFSGRVPRSIEASELA